MTFFVWRNASYAAGVFLASLILYSSIGLAAPNFLDEPAQAQKNPEKALILDIARAGGGLVAVGERGLAIYSSDQGRTWTQASVPVQETLTAVTFASPTQGWAVGGGGVILHTADGGKTWLKQFDGYALNKQKKAQAKAAIRRIQSTDKTNVDHADSSNDDDSEMGSVSRLRMLKRDLGDAEKALDRGPTLPLLDVWFRDQQTGIAVGGFGMAVRTTNGGKTWTRIASAIGNPYGWSLDAVSRVGDSLYIAAERGHIYRSDDLGQSWASVKGPYQGTYLGVTSSDDDRGLMVYGLQGRMYRSSDKGHSWQRVKTPFDASVTSAIYLSDGALVIVSASGGIACRVPDRSQFQLIRPKGRPLVDVESVGGDSMIMLAGMGGLSRMAIKNGCRGNDE